MAKIYDENGTRMSNDQVAIALKDIMPEEHKGLLSRAIEKNLGGTPIDGADNRRVFAHAVLDTYRFMTTDTTDKEKSKKWCKYLLDKYMKSTTSPTTGEEKAMKELVHNILHTVWEDGKK